MRLPHFFILKQSHFYEFKAFQAKSFTIGLFLFFIKSIAQCS
ncbi:hypothetical protein BSCG_00267 [Bacteroides sp. 2_2_4]|nr:hypothetical protein BSCG_00267 [Bacteroides sp. 2_2_4]